MLSLRNINNHILFIIFILFSTLSSSLTASNIFLVACIIYSLCVLFYRKGNIIKEIVLISIVWLVINIISICFNDPPDYHLLTLFARIGRILLYYAILKNIGKDFFSLYIKYVYVLSLISFPLYLADFAFTGLFDSFSSDLNFFSTEAIKPDGGWYIFFYMHNPWTLVDGFLRNSGFMWEPGGYGMVLVLALLLMLRRSHGIWNIQHIFLTICLLTTISTSAYLALSFIALYSLTIRGVKIQFILFVALPVFVCALFYIVQLDFVGGKINTFLVGIDNAHLQKNNDLWRVNRISILVYSFEQSLINPIGNGVYQSKYLIDKYGHAFAGANTIAIILYTWGYLGIAFLWGTFYRFFKVSLLNNMSSAILALVAFNIVLFSSSVDTRPFLWIPLLYPYVFKNTIIFPELN